MMMTKIYFVSGLGADSRAFRKLVFPKQFELVHLNWISALRNESLVAYAERLSLGIDTSNPFYLVGLSFGGMLATEIAKKLYPIHTFLISSTPVYKDLPWYFKAAGSIALQRAIPEALLKSGNTIGLKFLGAKTTDERKLLKQLVLDSDPAFIKWAMSCILNWRNNERPGNLTHIHGTADNILPIKYTHPDFVIKGGGHFMVYANAKEIMEIIIATIKTT
ncbi:pimeloyl-ACP methyl ester carboxylesterase [Pedobacter sp. UYP24]